MKSTNTHPLRKAFRVVGIILVSLIAVILIGVTALTLWLTPERLENILDTQLSKQMDADFRIHNPRFTFCRSFPHLELEVDSVSVKSRTLNGIPSSLAALLPENASDLAGAGKISADVNVLKLLSGKIALGRIEADSLRVNLVVLNDTLNNFNIVKSKGRKDVPEFSVSVLKLRRPGTISYRSIPDNALVNVNLEALDLLHTDRKNEYTLRFPGYANVYSGGVSLLQNLPFDMSGKLALRFHPFGIHTDRYDVALGGTRGRLSIDMNIGKNMKVNNFNYNLSTMSLTDLLQFLPSVRAGYPASLKADVGMNLTARLLSPWNIDNPSLPSLEVNFNIPKGKIVYRAMKGRDVEIDNIALRGFVTFDGNNPGATVIRVPQYNLSGEGTNLHGSIVVDRLATDPRIRTSLNGKSDLSKLLALAGIRKGLNIEGVVDMDADASASFSGLADGSLRHFNASGKFKAGKLQVSDSQSGMLASLDGASLICSFDSMLRAGSMTLVGKNLSAKMKEMAVALKNATLNFSLKRNRSGIIAPEFHTPEEWMADARTQAMAPHTPVTFHFTAPDRVKNLMKDWRVFLRIIAGSGTFTHSGLGAEPFTLDKVDMLASFDSLKVRHLALHSGMTAARLNGSVANLRQFLSSKRAAPLKANLNLFIDTVQINELARNYYHPHPDQAHRDSMPHPDDTITMLIPRNIMADVHLSAGETRYTNLHLYNLNGHLHMANGKVNVDSLRIGSDFGNAAANLVYDTSDMQQMGMDCNVNVSDVNVVNFFKNFKKVLAMMPQMKNLDGNLSAQCTAGLRIFPDMYLNVPSVTADINLQARGLTVKQDEFIRRITRMLLLPDGELKIADMNVHADVRNNLLHLYPFLFDVSKYSLKMLGLNNFDGKMYYHIGVEHSPLHIPFGINIQGDIHHPHISFGGKDWKDVHGAEISAGVMDSNHINVIRESRKYMHQFLSHAADYRGE